MLERTDLSLAKETDSLSPRKKKRQRPELGIQRAIIGFVGRACPGSDVRAIPNDSHQSHVKIRRRAEGVIAGTPDLVVVAPGGITVWLEVKAPKGVLSDAQKATHTDWRAKGHQVHVVRSIEEAEEALRQAGVPVFGTANPARELKRRGWECARELLERHRDRLTPKDMPRVLKAEKVGPVAISVSDADVIVRRAREIMGERV